MKTTGGNASLTISPPPGLSDNELRAWEEKRAEQEYQAKLEKQRSKLDPVFRSPKAAQVLALLAIEHPSGVDVYKIYELVAGKPANRNAFHTQFGVSADQFMRFEDAVHSPSVSGDWARHAYDKHLRTANPMSQGEAVNFVRELAAKWLASVRTGAVKP